jgi:hypothetical protein
LWQFYIIFFIHGGFHELVNGNRVQVEVAERRVSARIRLSELEKSRALQGKSYAPSCEHASPAG